MLSAHGEDLAFSHVFGGGKQLSVHCVGWYSGVSTDLVHDVLWLMLTPDEL